MTRVLHIAAMPFPSQQGTQAAIRAMLRAHISRGDEAHLLCYGYGSESETDKGVTIHRAAAARNGSLRSGPSFQKLIDDAALTVKLRALKSSFEDAIIVAHHVEAALACICANIPQWTFVAHTSLSAELPSYFDQRAAFFMRQSGKAMDAFIASRATTCAAVSPALALHLEAETGRAMRVLPVPWIAMAPQSTGALAHDEACRALSLSNDARRILYAGNLDSYQGLELLLQALADPQLGHAHLLVATNSEANAFLHAAAKYGVADRITIRSLASSRDRELVHQASHVACVPRRNLGGISIKLLDHLARGLAVVAHPLALGGYDFEHAIRVESEAPAMANALSAAIANVSEHTCSTASADALLQKYFSTDAYLRAFDATARV